MDELIKGNGMNHWLKNISKIGAVGLVIGCLGMGMPCWSAAQGYEPLVEHHPAPSAASLNPHVLVDLRDALSTSAKLTVATGFFIAGAFMYCAASSIDRECDTHAPCIAMKATSFTLMGGSVACVMWYGDKLHRGLMATYEACRRPSGRRKQAETV